MEIIDYISDIVVPRSSTFSLVDRVLREFRQMNYFGMMSIRDAEVSAAVEAAAVEAAAAEAPSLPRPPL